MPKKCDRSNPSNYRPIVSIFFLSKAFETILNRKFLKYLSSFNLLSDYRYGFRKGWSTGDLLAFLTDSWSSFLSRFGETFVVVLDISQAFHRVWQKALLSKLSCCFSAVVGSHSYTPKPINSGVPQDSVLSPTLFFVFTNDHLSLTNSSILSYADDATLHCSTSFDKRPNLHEL